MDQPRSHGGREREKAMGTRLKVERQVSLIPEVSASKTIEIFMLGLQCFELKEGSVKLNSYHVRSS